jgi:hypothetical protein
MKIKKKMNEHYDLNGTPEQQIPLKKGQEYLASSGYTSTFKFNFVDANECECKKPTLLQRFLNLFRRDE